MVFDVSTLGYIQNTQSIILDYAINIKNLRRNDQMFDAGALGNFSLAGFEMVIFIKMLTQLKCRAALNFFLLGFHLTISRLSRGTSHPISSPTTCHQVRIIHRTQIYRPKTISLFLYWRFIRGGLLDIVFDSSRHCTWQVILDKILSALVTKIQQNI